MKKYVFNTKDITYIGTKTQIANVLTKDLDVDWINDFAEKELIEITINEYGEIALKDVYFWDVFDINIIVK